MNGWVFSSRSPPTVARRTCTITSVPVPSWPPRTRVRVGGLGEAAHHGVAVPVEGAPPSGVVLLRLAQHRVVRLEQLEADVDRCAGSRAEQPAHGPILGGAAACAHLTCRVPSRPRDRWPGTVQTIAYVRPGGKIDPQPRPAAGQEAAGAGEGVRLPAPVGPRSIVRLSRSRRRWTPPARVRGRPSDASARTRSRGSGQGGERTPAGTRRRSSPPQPASSVAARLAAEDRSHRLIWRDAPPGAARNGYTPAP